MVPKIDDPAAHPARQRQKVIDRPARIDLPLGELGHFVPEEDPALQVQLAEGHGVVGEEVRLARLHDDDIEELAPVVTHHVGHALVHRLEGGIGDEKDPLAGRQQSFEVGLQLGILGGGALLWMRGLIYYGSVSYWCPDPISNMQSNLFLF